MTNLAIPPVSARIPTPRLPQPPSAATPPPGTDIVLSWHQPSGWAHLTRHYEALPMAPIFVGFRHIPATGAGALRAALDRAGLIVLCEEPVPCRWIVFRLAGTLEHAVDHQLCGGRRGAWLGRP